MKGTRGSGVCICVRGEGLVGGWEGVTLTMAVIVYQSPSSINQDDPALIGVLVKLVSRPPFPPLA